MAHRQWGDGDTHVDLSLRTHLIVAEELGLEEAIALLVLVLDSHLESVVIEHQNAVLKAAGHLNPEQMASAFTLTTLQEMAYLVECQRLEDWVELSRVQLLQLHHMRLLPDGRHITRGRLHLEGGVRLGLGAV